MIGHDTVALELLLAAFAGGAFGAAIGALPTFVFTGVLVIAGETLTVARQSLAPDAAVPPVTDAIALGVVFGPHVSFAGGAAAAAYAARRGYLDEFELETEYHPAKHVTSGLGTKPDVLLVGGLFGAAGHLLFVVSETLSAPWDPVAIGVVFSALLHRAVFGYALIGRVRTDGLLDMSPFERGQRLASDGGRPVVDPWLEHMFRWEGVAVLGVVVGILGAYIAYLTASPFLAFGISAATLVFMTAGVDRIPVTHHITLPASTAPLAVAGLSAGELSPAAVAAAIPLWQALLVGAAFGLVGAAFGLVGALAGELCQRVFYAHADTHLDPPAASIVVSTALIAGLAMAGVLETAVWIPHP